MLNQKLTFVVGTGRCGSTALSQVINLHPDVLSVNELFASIPDSKALAEAPLSGPEFWGYLSRPNAATNSLIKKGAIPPEFLYHRLPKRRFDARTTGIPAVSVMTLPHLTDDPDTVFDELESEVASWPTRRPADHWAAFFATLAARFGNPGAVVERSGMSLGRVTDMHRAFPEARFVHLYREGPDCAVSMSRHISFRMLPLGWEMAIRCGLESPFELTPEHAAQLPPDLAPLLGDEWDPALVMDRPIPLPAFGGLWSRMIEDGLRRLEAVPAAQRTALSYETLLEEPEKELTRLAEFIGVGSPRDWVDASTALLDGDRRGAAQELSDEESAALLESCKPGMLALAAHP
ncbi:sulfotransferase [Streptomyces samsunensis]|uniref:Sulfotransferase n=1 Tax=Streptomyces malaysiensis subsp. samsunensis TaxID=459658 RepID=A0A9X2LQ71_STRMQ|nr:sulfotransferase [Streptomyces samsunensis]